MLRIWVEIGCVQNNACPKTGCRRKKFWDWSVVRRGILIPPAQRSRLTVACDPGYLADLVIDEHIVWVYMVITEQVFSLLWW